MTRTLNLREDVGSFQFGTYEFEKDVKLFAEDQVPPTFGADLLPEDFEAVERQWERAIERVPALGEVGIKANTRGSFQMSSAGSCIMQSAITGICLYDPTSARARA